MTNFPNGISSFGAPVVPGYAKAGMGVDNGGSVLRPTKHFWVHGNLGNNGNPGLSPSQPLRTMAAAFAQVGSGDVIHFGGNITENLSTPVGVFDVTIVGEGNRPRHADAHTTNNGYSGATWKAASATDALLTIRQQGWRLVNFLMDAPTSDACVDMIRDAASGDSERDSSHAEFLGIKFASGATGILVTGTENVFNVRAEGCVFTGLTTAIDSAGGYAHQWQIRDNSFLDNTNHIDVGFTNAVIKGNVFGKVTTLGVDLTGGATNVVSGNYFMGDYNVLNVAGTDDMWAGNFVGETGGVSDAVPTGS